MALADTARLIASLELQDKFSGTASKFSGTLSKMESQTSTLGRIGGQISSGIGAASANLQRIGLIGVGVLTANITAGVASLEKLESVSAQTEAVLKSTSGVAGLTADQIRNLAEKYETLNATIDDKVIQSAENLLLTFTNVKDKAFEPSLQAILDMNQAMGGGPEGLQDTVIRVGKALQDPIRGFTALRRVGVNITKEQQDQIKVLIAQNDLYGAQQIILKELATEFGGSFARAGQTTAGKFAAIKDAVDDAQQALATAFLPVLVKVADKLGSFLADPAVIARIESFGSELAGGFDKLLQVGGSLPWQQIGDAFTIVGTGSKALLDAFLGLPPWVQTAVLTGWGLNKLTGGALTGIAGTLTKALVSGGFGGRGSTPLNPLFVQQVGAAGGPGGVAAGPGALSGLLPTLLATGAGVGIGGLVAAPIAENSIGPARKFEASQFNELTDRLSTSNTKLKDIDAAIAKLEVQQKAIGSNSIDLLAAGASELGGIFTGQKGVLSTLNEQLGSLRAQRAEVVAAAERTDARQAQLQAVLATLPFGIGASISQNFKPIVNVSLTSNVSVSVSNVVRTLNSYTAAIGSGPGGAINPAL